MFVFGREVGRKIGEGGRDLEMEEEKETIIYEMLI